MLWGTPEHLTKTPLCKDLPDVGKEVLSMIISWDEYFMGVAIFSAYRSKDPHTQVGACIVNGDKHIVGVGYNGMPNGCDDSVYPWGRTGTFAEQKYAYVVHAELNAILNAYTQLKGCSIYVSLFPCNECCKAIIQSGIREVVYLSDKYAETDSTKASKRMLASAGVTCRRMETDLREIPVRFAVDA